MKIFDSRFSIQEKRTLVLVAGVLLLVDQAAKFFFSGSERYYCNAGGPWGMWIGNGVMIAVMTVILGVAGYFFWKEGRKEFLCHSHENGNPGVGDFVKKKESDRGIRIPVFTGMTPQRLALAFILGGGLSNLIDRIISGCVRDFALVSWFPAFNLADAYLTVGVFLLAPVLFPATRNTKHET